MKPKQMILALAVTLALTLTAAAQNTKLKVLHNFGASDDGNVPSGPLLSDAHGNLYGGTGGGPGQYGNGVAFELSPQKNGNWHETILHTFASIDGSPWGVFVRVAGKLYGTTVGGPVSDSEAYQLTPGTGGWGFDAIYADGAGPGLLPDALGNLYGSIGPGDYFGAGAIGVLSSGSGTWTYAQLYSFCGQIGCPDGYNPPAPPIWDTKGNLWGVMTYGGIGRPACFSDFGCGAIFEMTPNGDGTWTYDVQHLFASSSTDGQWPYGGLVMDAAGNFYGSTWLGGAYNNGTIFKFAFTGGQWEETVLYDFPNCVYGCGVEGTLAMDKAGNLYGTAAGGRGSCAGFACGVVFTLAVQPGGTWKYGVLYHFTESTGGLQPFYGVILDGKGNLYGVTSSFGKYGGGTAFEITP
jgi:uncharacterized repeat protein (TIGR03803 family)